MIYGGPWRRRRVSSLQKSARSYGRPMRPGRCPRPRRRPCQKLSKLDGRFRPLQSPYSGAWVRGLDRPASMERRRRWAASGALPPALAARFTLAETAVLAVIAAEVLRHSACTLVIGHIAALAGVSETTVRNALREARGLGLLTLEERRLTAWRNAPNVVRVVSREWLAWLRLRASKERAWGEGANSRRPRLPKRIIRARWCSRTGVGLPKGREPGGRG